MNNHLIYASLKNLNIFESYFHGLDNCSDISYYEKYDFIYRNIPYPGDGFGCGYGNGMAQDIGYGKPIIYDRDIKSISFNYDFAKNDINDFF